MKEKEMLRLIFKLKFIRSHSLSASENQYTTFCDFEVEVMLLRV